MDKVHDIDADGEFDGPPSTENTQAQSAAALMGRPDSTGQQVLDPFLAPPPPTNPRTMYICAGVVAFGLLMVAIGLLFGGGRARSEPRPVSAAQPQGYLAQQQQMAREAMSMAREAQQMQRERLDLMRQQMMEGDGGPGSAEAATTEFESSEE